MRWGPLNELPSEAETALRFANSTLAREREWIRASYYDLVGRGEEAMVHYAAAMQLDADQFFVGLNLARMHKYLGHARDAVGPAIKAAALRSDSLAALELAAQTLLGVGEVGRARQYADRARELVRAQNLRERGLGVGQNRLKVVRAELLRRAGDRAGALRLFREGIAGLRHTGDDSLFLAAESLAELLEVDGDADSAVHVLSELGNEREHLFDDFTTADGWIRIRARQAALADGLGRRMETESIDKQLAHFSVLRIGIIVSSLISSDARECGTRRHAQVGRVPHVAVFA